MTFRDDRDALLARNEALEREVEEAKRALAEKDAELERRAQPPREPPASGRGRELAEALISGSREAIEEHLRELSGAPRPVRDAVGREFAAYLKRGGAMARAVCTLYVEHTPPRFQGSVHDKLRSAFVKATADPETRSLAERALAVLGGEKRTATGKSGAGKSLPARILLVFTRAWVIVVFWLPALFAIALIVSEPGARVIAASALAGAAVLVIALEAFLRRCPSCRRWLAGIFLRVVRDQYDSHVTSWRCTHCSHHWQTSRYAGPQ